ncbi:WD repeat protein [Rhizodiscina lignyota]|uniref:WD repeat protein n=1 Tax=Rhizodiscina lignyota TaxID=1504668 RepID=A0A9P4IEN7_9PEZI|nr:WD repeat protein [Rhizodiscina lignyota]
MSKATDPRHFFQTTNAINISERKATKSKNTHGNPIKLRSKILACASDPHDGGRVYVAQAGGIIENVALESGEITATYAGPNAPVTCLAVSQTHVFGGCWDKTIYSWPISSSSVSPIRPDRIFSAGHTDFVKALLYVPLANKELLISGGADAAITVWDAQKGEKLHVLKEHGRGVQALTLDPLSTSAEGVSIFSADSSREIRRWRLTGASASEVDVSGNNDLSAETECQPLVAHETSVYALRFDADGDMWTASADKTAKCLVRERGWAADTELVHPDFVRDIAIDEDGGWIVTACRDEEVRLWERASGKLFHTFSGHFEEVTGLLLVGRTVVTVSIDATIRKWSLKPDDLKKAREETKAQELGNAQVEEAISTSMLTEEEERELAELMDEDD